MTGRLNVMVDIETLSTRVDAVVVGIGLALFTSTRVVDTVWLQLAWGDQASLSRAIEQKTLAWWLDQDPRVARLNLTGATATPAGLRRASSFIQGAPVNRTDADSIVWGNPPSFDLAVLKGLYELFGYPIPWSYRNERCYRTARRGRDQRISIVPHNPVEDACAAALDLIEWGEVLP